MGFRDFLKQLFNGAQSQTGGGKTAICPHCGTQNSAKGYGTPPIPGVIVTEVLEIDCRKCGRMFIVM